MSRFTYRTICLTWMENLYSVKEELLGMLRITMADILSLDGYAAAHYGEAKIADAVLSYENSLSPALEKRILNWAETEQKSHLGLEQLSQLHLISGDLCKVSLVAFYCMYASSSGIMKSKFLEEGFRRLDIYDHSVLSFLRDIPVLWLILLAGMERLHSLREKNSFSFLQLYRECVETLHQYTDEVVGRYEESAFFVAFEQLRIMNLCCDADLKAVEKGGLVQNQRVKLCSLS